MRGTFRSTLEYVGPKGPVKFAGLALLCAVFALTSSAVHPAYGKCRAKYAAGTDTTILFGGASRPIEFPLEVDPDGCGRVESSESRVLAQPVPEPPAPPVPLEVQTIPRATGGRGAAGGDNLTGAGIRPDPDPNRPAPKGP